MASPQPSPQPSPLPADQAPASRKRSFALLRYTLLRIGLFVVVWLVLEFLTPLSLAWTLIGAIVMSGAISVVVLDRTRGEAGRSVSGYFRRINARIEASTSAEDAADDAARAAAAATASASAQGEGDAQDQPVAEQQGSGALEGGDQSGPSRG